MTKTRIKQREVQTTRLLQVLLALTLASAACSLGTPAVTPSPVPAGATATLVPPPGETPRPSPPTETPGATTQPAGSATQFPDANQFWWVAVASGLDGPVDIQDPGDGSGRLFVLEKPGRIRILQNGGLLPAPYLDISARVGSNSSERGLLGLAFHPRYAENGYFYVNYTDAGGNTVIARFNRSTEDPNLADPNSEVRLLSVAQPFANHNGGVVTFGPDGYLYLGLGDGGSAGDPLGNGQSLNTHLGKLLRLDVDHGDPYAIPADNPFASGGGLPEIWAYGLRNPWRIAFDPSTGDLYIGDVGQNKWEEIDYVPAGTPGGLNFGWNIMEGTHPYSGENPGGRALVAPVAEYGHGPGCSVTGGKVYRGLLPEWQGIFLYGDYCSGQVWGLLQDSGLWQTQLLFSTGFTITTFGQDAAGELYLSDYRAGVIYRLERR